MSATTQSVSDVAKFDIGRDAPSSGLRITPVDARLIEGHKASQVEICTIFNITEAAPVRVPLSILYFPSEMPVSWWPRGFALHVSHECATRLRADLNPFAEAGR